jgi:peptidoglycan hydrolase-like protein with peptidoglycan-binding domain
VLLSGDVRKIGAIILLTENNHSVVGPGTVDAIRQFEAKNKFPATGTMDAVTQAMLNNAAAMIHDFQNQFAPKLTRSSHKTNST